MTLDWESVIGDSPDVVKLVHLAMRYDSVDEDAWRVELLKARRSAYEDELTIQAGRSGCTGRIGRLTNNTILSEINKTCVRDAKSICNTYNYDMLAAATKIRAEIPTANRNVYAKRLADWKASRDGWKANQIAQYTLGTARAQAQQDFHNFNVMNGYAVLRPVEAVCPVCQGWVNRGRVPLTVATGNPPPYHPSCILPNEKVLMGDKKEIPIQEIVKGDVISTSKGNCLVEKVYCRDAEELVYRIFVDNQVLQLTGDHPVKTDHGWISARELKVDDLILTVMAHEC